jgi:hypothetical protein
LELFLTITFEKLVATTAMKAMNALFFYSASTQDQAGR